jgi:phosphoglycerate dehydrogenase-like enzyme
MRFLFVAFLCAFPLHAQKKIVVATGGEALASQLQAVTPKARVVLLTPANRAQELPDADAYIGDISPAEVRAAKKLQWVQVMSAGVEKILFPASGEFDLLNSNITLTNNKVVQGPEIADHALAMLLMLSRNLYKLYNNDKQEIWDSSNYKGIELNGKTAVVIGVGGVGSQIALRANAFGMNVIGVDPEDKPFLPFVKRMVKPDQLDDVLPEADVVFISVPDTPRATK